MRIATLQFTPTLGDVAASIAHAEELLSTNLSQLQNLDLLVLPELAFTGAYVKRLYCGHLTPNILIKPLSVEYRLSSCLLPFAASILCRVVYLSISSAVFISPGSLGNVLGESPLRS